MRRSKWGQTAAVGMKVVSVCLTISVAAACSSRLEKSETDPALGDEVSARPAAQLDPWAAIHSKPYGINATALAAYAYAASVMDQSAPGCGIGWPTLAAVGWVESRNATDSGAKVDGDGNVSPKLRALTLSDPDRIGIVADTDGGRYDGSKSDDKAMGPMQFLPSKWEQWSTDANNDGTPDPDNIDDAALSVARFLCATGGDLRVPEGWTKAVASYSPAKDYAAKVHGQAEVYGR